MSEEFDIFGKLDKFLKDDCKDLESDGDDEDILYDEAEMRIEMQGAINNKVKKPTNQNKLELIKPKRNMRNKTKKDDSHENSTLVLNTEDVFPVDGSTSSKTSTVPRSTDNGRLDVDLDAQLKNLDQAYQKIMKTTKTAKASGKVKDQLDLIESYRKEAKRITRSKSNKVTKTSTKTNTANNSVESQQLMVIQAMFDEFCQNQQPASTRGRSIARGRGRTRNVSAKRAAASRSYVDAVQQADSFSDNDDIYACNYNHIDSIAPPSISSRLRRMRGRKTTSNVIDTIDLVSSPLLHIPGIVNLDSDDEADQKKNEVLSAADFSFDSDNFDISIKVKWNGRIDKFSHRNHQKFSELIQKLAVRENTDSRYIVLDLNDKVIQPDDTPDTIGYTISKFISGRIVKELGGQLSARTKNRNENEIELKIQSELWKKPLVVTVGKSQKMKIVVVKCAEELKCKAEQVKLRFDGESIELQSTPDDLELEGGEIIDCRIVE